MTHILSNSSSHSKNPEGLGLTIVSVGADLFESFAKSTSMGKTFSLW